MLPRRDFLTKEACRLLQGGFGARTRNCTELPPIPKERIALKCFAGKKLASLTGFAPVISCMRGRHVDWTTPQGLAKGNVEGAGVDC